MLFGHAIPCHFKCSHFLKKKKKDWILNVCFSLSYICRQLQKGCTFSNKTRQIRVEWTFNFTIQSLVQFYLDFLSVNLFHLHICLFSLNFNLQFNFPSLCYFYIIKRLWFSSLYYKFLASPSIMFKKKLSDGSSNPHHADCTALLTLQSLHSYATL